jgi:hypothetical protein
VITIDTTAIVDVDELEERRRRAPPANRGSRSQRWPPPSSWSSSTKAGVSAGWPQTRAADELRVSGGGRSEPVALLHP